MTKQQGKTEKLVNTRLTHDGYQPRDYHGFVNPPVVRASTVLFPDAETMATGNQKYTYGTRGTPTSDALCAAIDALEGSAGTICVPSGLAAVTIPLLAFLSPGDHALFVDSIYNPTRHFADTILKRMGVDVEYYDPEIGSGIAKLMRPNTKVVFTESPASNTFEMQDIPAIAEEAHKGGAIVMMDNTWATHFISRHSISAWTSPSTPRQNIHPVIRIFCLARFRPTKMLVAASGNARNT